MIGGKLEKFRDVTRDSHSKMAGVTVPSFVCVRCKQSRRVPGRKQVVRGAPKFGYVCAGCAA